MIPFFILKVSLLLHLVNSIPFNTDISPSTQLNKHSIPVPVVIWHGLGDKVDNPGLLSLKADLESRPNLKGIFVHLIYIALDGAGDQKASFFGNANTQVQLVCDQLLALEEITNKDLNPSQSFDAIGFSQGGQLLRAVVERCGGEGGLKVRNLITVGSQHMGISALPACPPDSSIFSSCRLLHLSIVRNGLYSSFAQNNLIPAQYVRDEARIDDYLNINHFLKDVNNERKGDKQVGPLPENNLQRRRNSVNNNNDDEEDELPRNATYKANLIALTNFVMFRFELDTTVVPPQSAHFTLPSPYATNCPTPSLPSCYLDPVPYSYLPLFASDYIGLRTLDERNAMKLENCLGTHMQIDEVCWEKIVSWLGVGDGKLEVEEIRKFVIQL